MPEQGLYPRWIGANCLGEALGLGTKFVLGTLVAAALGMLVIFAGMDRLPWESGGLSLYAGLFAAAAVAGAVVGAVHGRVLLGLQPTRR